MSKLENLFKLSEREIEQDILSYLQARNVFIYKIEQMGTYDPKKRIYRKNESALKVKGISDLLGTHNTTLAIEVKTIDGLKKVAAAIRSYRKHGYATKSYQREIAQWKFIKETRRRGGVAFFTCSLLHTIKTLKKHKVLT